MNHSLAAFKRWRIQIFAITWLAYAAFYFTRKAFSVAFTIASASVCASIS